MSGSLSFPFPRQWFSDHPMERSVAFPPCWQPQRLNAFSQPWPLSQVTPLDKHKGSSSQKGVFLKSALDMKNYFPLFLIHLSLLLSLSPSLSVSVSISFSLPLFLSVCCIYSCVVDEKGHLISVSLCPLQLWNHWTTETTTAEPGHFWLS